MKIKKANPLQPEKIWSQYGKMIMKIAHNLSRRFNREYDELLSDGVVALLKKLPKYDPDRSGLCTYVYRCAYWGMLDSCLKPLREIPMDTYNPGENNPFIQKETQPHWFRNFLSELTEETRVLVKILFEAPEELYEGIKPNQPKTSQKKLREYMIDVLDWTTEDVELAFKEVAECL